VRDGQRATKRYEWRQPASGSPAVSAGLSRLGDTLARLVAAVPLRYWRFGAGCGGLGRPLARGGAGQALPVGPTGYGNSPYQALSSFAGNELLISPEGLIEDGLVRSSDCEAASFAASLVDYDAIIPFKRRILETAWRNFCAGTHTELQAAYEEFYDLHSNWLEDYALYRALKARYNDVYYLEWPVELIRRIPAALARARQQLASHVDQVRFAQFLLFRQAERLKEYARAAGLRLIGDLPFFVSPDSSDVWANPELLLLDELHRPRFVAGVPPDYFSATGQLWGNPVYDGDAMRKHRLPLVYRSSAGASGTCGYRAPRPFPRLHGRLACAGRSTNGTVRPMGPGPGGEFFEAVRKEVGSLPFIVEDLGLITPDVGALRDRFDLAGTRVLQFAFDGHPDNPHLPNIYIANTVLYTGTHDNPPTREWYEELSASQRGFLWQSLKRPEAGSSDAAPALMELAWFSPAALAIAPLQDVLNLGAEARMNMPGRAEGNWRWRCPANMLSVQRLNGCEI
jgi:4-alpha-glucanotransferase